MKWVKRDMRVLTYSGYMGNWISNAVVSPKSFLSYHTYGDYWQVNTPLTRLIFNVE
jgi:hypothetical protein